MGRESRRKLDDNRGNRWRKTIARNECFKVLAGDLRVQQHFEGWVRAMDALERFGPPNWIPPDTPHATIERIIERGEIDYLAEVLQKMGVPWRWCAEGLIKVLFPILLHNYRHPDDRQSTVVEFDLRGVPKGRVPRHGGQDVAEWVRWWYRRKIKHPADELHVLVEEYAKRENRVTEAHSVVQNGIKRAEMLLAL